jgi:hypothetical protein
MLWIHWCIAACVLHIAWSSMPSACSICEIVPSSGCGPCPIRRKPLRGTGLIDTISEVCTAWGGAWGAGQEVQ